MCGNVTHDDSLLSELFLFSIIPVIEGETFLQSASLVNLTV